MNLLGCLDTPTAGSYIFNGKDVSQMTDDELGRYKKYRNWICVSNFQPSAKNHSLRQCGLTYDIRRKVKKGTRGKSF
jgi:ABC-type lipoprotein export system ATPase subunit